MVGMGTVVNVAAIAGGSLLGLLVGRGIKEKYQETVIYGLALCVIVLGIQMALQGQHILLTIISLVVGSILGEALGIEEKLEQVGTLLAEKFQKSRKKGDAGTDAFVEGFLNASLLYCVGAMAIVGSIQDGLSGDPTTLYTKALIDGLSGIIYASNFGVGVLFSALSVGVYQGILTALAGFLGPWMSQLVVQEVAACGGLMILGIGINMTKLLKIRVGNMLPGLLVAGVAAGIFF
ncbi:DUF554 domain-containing protein [Acidaminococcus fermentans]|jgi:uncharacterized membrane protein YqgA involved in biofilm formation|uniref:DUF554 domain-containing protein n=2 Tax=Acidaminococcus TaxID=904 RepID=A0A6N7W0Q9_ACIFE|nr:DUF554 domain-containing protein [Acidaminococcus fermentans]MEE1598043.1 DUF554 domain-containing protein [Acidaminococcus fermentans]MEE4122305.1 DUF554 domain-containing protein [Acidaminococcus fermentans]MSS82032.1 DUF554 domain-containing protein [Acidaminococcus fermentans]CDE93958.1 putative uncharacterized protein [Acidaminococcus sp. CAG:542]